MKRSFSGVKQLCGVSLFSRNGIMADVSRYY
jgi:hypothetical protein